MSLFPLVTGTCGAACWKTEIDGFGEGAGCKAELDGLGEGTGCKVELSGLGEGFRESDLKAARSLFLFLL